MFGFLTPEEFPYLSVLQLQSHSPSLRAVNRTDHNTFNLHLRPEDENQHEKEKRKVIWKFIMNIFKQYWRRIQSLQTEQPVCQRRPAQDEASTGWRCWAQHQKWRQKTFPPVATAAAAGQGDCPEEPSIWRTCQVKTRVDFFFQERMRSRNVSEQPVLF